MLSKRILVALFVIFQLALPSFAIPELKLMDQSGDVTIAGVSASQRTDGTGLVDIHYALTGSVEEVHIEVFVSSNNREFWDITPSREYLSGDVGSIVSSEGRGHIVWDARADHPETCWPQCRVRIIATGAMAQQPSPPEAEARDKTLRVALSEDVTIEFSQVPAGAYTRGSPDTERGRLYTESPAHDVALDYVFYMSKRPVTQQEWWALMSEWPGTAPSALFGLGDDHPIYFVSWYDAKRFITALNIHIEQTGQGPLRMRLPSEAEWEYACRAGTRTRFHFGDSLDVDDACGYDEKRDNFMWYCGNNERYVVMPTGQKEPNAFGLYDMHGNIYEWCEDDWHENYNGAPRDGSSWTFSDDATSRAIRGGSWNDEARSCRSASRRGAIANSAQDYIGFRLVAVLDASVSLPFKVNTATPKLSLIGEDPMILECGQKYEEPGATARDACDGNLRGAVVISGDTVDSAVVGDYRVVYNVSDAMGNPAAEITRLAQVVDTTAPVITIEGGASMITECGAPISLPRAAALDACDGTVDAFVADLNGLDLENPIRGIYDVVYNAEDAFGNIGVALLNVTVVDTTPPAILLPDGAYMTAECGMAFSLPLVVALDICDGEREAAVADLDGLDLANPSTGIHEVLYKAADNSNNLCKSTLTVEVEDTTPPVISLLGENPATVEYRTVYEDAGATALDACDGDISAVVKAHISVDTDVRGKHWVRYTVNDSSGNAAREVVRTVLVEDATPPFLVEMQVESAETVLLSFSEPMGDNALLPHHYALSGSGQGTFADTPDTVERVSEGNYRLRWREGKMRHGGDIGVAVDISLTDPAGLPMAEPNFLLHGGGAMADAPEILTCAPEQTLVADLYCVASVPDFTGALVVQDSRASAETLLITQTPDAGTQTGLGDHVVTLVVTDGAGNTAACETTLHVYSLVAPQVDFDASNTAGLAPMTVAFRDLTVSKDAPVHARRWDFGDGAISEETHPVHTYIKAGVYTVTLYAEASPCLSDTRVKEKLIQTTPGILGREQCAYFTDSLHLEWPDFYPDASGYRWRVDRLPIVSLKESNSNLTIEARAFVDNLHRGAWYLHLTALDSEGNAITDSQAALPFRIAGSMPRVISDSHPDLREASPKRRFVAQIGVVNYDFDRDSSWLQVTDNAPWSGRNSHAAAAFNGKLWVLGGWDGEARNDVWCSEDGLNWTSPTQNAPWSERFGHGALVFDNKIWVLGGRQGPYLLNDVWWSEDGETWRQSDTDAPWSGRAHHGVVSFNGNIWVLGGDDGALKNDIWRSEDGIHWRQTETYAVWTPREKHQVVVFQDNLWVLGGWDGAAHCNDVWQFEDGGEWRLVTSHADWTGRAGHAAAVFDNSMWVLGGVGGNRLRDIWRSEDGASWRQITHAADWSARDGHRVVFFDDAPWVLGGYDGARHSDVWIWNPLAPEDCYTRYFHVIDEHPDTSPGPGDSESSEASIVIPKVDLKRHWFHVTVEDAVGNLSEPAHYPISVRPLEPPVISSPTHPNPERTYVGRDVVFEWTDSDNTATKFFYEFNRHEKVSLSPVGLGVSEKSASFSNVAPGKYYFHLRAADDEGAISPTVHFHITIGVE